MSKNYSRPIEDRLFKIFNERFKNFSIDYKNAHSSTISNISNEYFVKNDSSTMFYEENDLKNIWHFHLRKIGMRLTYSSNFATESEQPDVLRDKIYISDPCHLNKNLLLIEIKYDDAIKILSLGCVP